VKKWFAALLGLALLVGCSSESSSDTEKKDEPKQEEVKQDEGPTQEELDAQLKEEAVQADFVELNSDEAETGKKVFTEGVIDSIAKEGMLGEFTLTTEEGEGVGMYTVVDVMGSDLVKEGTNIKVYGVYEGKDDLGFPKINATVIEQP
jgi:colicin import membrane protein